MQYHGLTPLENNEEPDEEVSRSVCIEMNNNCDECDCGSGQVIDDSISTTVGDYSHCQRSVEAENVCQIVKEYYHQ